MKRFTPIALAAALAAGAVAQAPATSVAADLFAGKQLTIIAGYRPGGGVDNNARLVGAHLGKHIPGSPTIINKNMPGAGGARLANWLYNKADKDGFTIALPGRSWMMSRLLKDPGIKYDPVKFDYIGSLGPVPYYLFVRADSGIGSLDALKKSKRQVVFGGLTKRASNYVVPAILAADGWPVKALHGYKGTANILLAIEQKEVDGMYASYSTILNNRGDLIDKKVLIPIATAGGGKPAKGVKLPALPDSMGGKARGVYSLVTAPSTWGVPVIAPPGTDKAALAVLRGAYDKMVRDPAFLADAKKRGIVVEDPNTGPEVQKVIASVLANADEASVKAYLNYVQRTKKKKK
jgi:tripartite-type tricarboxylate transporter receptor subunit TctC